jgi:hypothetical protein
MASKTKTTGSTALPQPGKAVEASDLEANKAIALRLAEVFNGRRLDLLEDLLHPEFRARGISAFPPNSPDVGPGVRRKLYEMFYQAIPDARADVLEVVAEGDKVVILDRFGGTHRGEFFGRPGTADRIEWMAMHIYTIRDGKVLEDPPSRTRLPLCSNSVSCQAYRRRRSKEAKMAGSQTVLSILDEAAAAMGGWTTLQSIRSAHLESEGQDWEPWQAHDIGGIVDVSTFRVATDLDLGASASRVEMNAAVVYPWPHRVAYIETTDAEAGMLAGLSLGAVAITRLHPSLYVTARRDFAAFAPEALRLARADAGAVLERTSVRFRHNVADRWATLAFADDRTPASLTYADHDPVLGDIAYALNGPIGGMWAAFVCLTDCGAFVEGRPIREERLRRVTLNEPLSHDKFTIPAIVCAQDEAGRRIVTGWTQRRRAAGLPYEEYTRLQHVDMAPLAPGVWLARGGTHNSFVIEMSDHLVVFEPPLFEGRSEEVIAAAKKSAPGKPIRHIVLSHFHDDHMDGVRTYAAEGATVVVHSSAGDYIHAVLGQRRTLEPDRLELARRDGLQNRPDVMLVDDAIALTDGTREVKLYQVPNTH